MSFTLKWGSESFTLSIPEPCTAKTLRDLVKVTTSVPLERQKLMSKAWKGILKDDQALSLTTGLVVILMGSAETSVAPIDAPKFIEDASAKEVAAAGVSLPAGLANMGNTCYANSVLECLRGVPDLSTATQHAASMGSGGSPMSTQLGALFRSLGSQTEAVAPVAFLRTLWQHRPAFAERTPQGGMRQQDAEECLGTILGAMAEELTVPTPALPSLLRLPDGGPSNVVDTLFGIAMEEELKCIDCPGEAPLIKLSGARKLVCNIDGGVAGAASGRAPVNVSHLGEGLALGMSEEGIVKRSESLGRDALWSRHSRISRLPKYLCVQMMRFFFKKADADTLDRGGVAGTPCKILKSVSFPVDKFDVLPYCSAPLKGALGSRRAAALKAEDAERAARLGGVGGSGSGGGAVSVIEGGDSSIAATAAQSSLDGLVNPGVPESFQGYYDLCGVVTHKGRDSSSGHYISFVRNDTGKDVWYAFDDDEVEITNSEVVGKMKGGGDDL